MMSSPYVDTFFLCRYPAPRVHVYLMDEFAINCHLVLLSMEAAFDVR